MPRHRACRSARAAFTLVEMLIVIGILMLLLGLTAGSVLRTPRVDALVATEQLLTDMIRQARHTARSTGSPVLLQISAANRTIMGVSQVPIWSETFEEVPSSGVDWRTAFGQTGCGLASPGGSPPDAPPTYAPLPHNLALTRNAAATSGFYLSCAVNLPDVSACSAQIQQNNPEQAVIPLVLIGAQTDSTATCGLAVRWKLVPVQSVTDNSGNPIVAQYAVWDVIGWVNDATNGFVQVASVENTVFAPSMNLPMTQQSNQVDVAGPIVGGRWEDLGLLYDGTNLELMRNGQQIASLVAANGAAPATGLTGTLVDTTNGGGPQSIFAAAAYMPKLTNVASPPMSYLQGTLDNCRLFRLGTEHPTLLPSGIVPAGDYTLRVRPDGIVEFRGTGAATTLGGTLAFTAVHTAVSPGNSDAVQITVNPDGSLTSMVSAGSTSASAAGVQ